jgi:hypothetical protein
VAAHDDEPSIGKNCNADSSMASPSTELRGEDMARDTPWPVVLGIVASIMIGVGFVACAGPTRRGLRIQPIQALREGA